MAFLLSRRGQRLPALLLTDKSMTLLDSAKMSSLKEKIREQEEAVEKKFEKKDSKKFFKKAKKED